MASATVLLRQSVEMAPNENASKYMYLGQALEGAEAVENFERGLAIMQRDLESLQPSPDTDVEEHAQELRRGLCAGYCAIAEVLLPDADTTASIYTRCERALQQAQQVRYCQAVAELPRHRH